MRNKKHNSTTKAQQLAALSYLDSNGLEQCWVSKRKLHHLFDLSQLLSHSSDVIVAHLVQRLLLILYIPAQDVQMSMQFIFAHRQPM